MSSPSPCCGLAQPHCDVQKYIDTNISDMMAAAHLAYLSPSLSLSDPSPFYGLMAFLWALFAFSPRDGVLYRRVWRQHWMKCYTENSVGVSNTDGIMRYDCQFRQLSGGEILMWLWPVASLCFK
jgi:hypothetical protein